MLARHPHQGAAATACGADHVVLGDPDNGHWEELAALSGSRVIGRKRHQMLMGGFPYVVEAVGSPQSVTEALRAVAHRGTVLLLGAAGISEVDLTPIWYKEAALVGSIDHTVDASSAPGLAGGPGRHSVDRALDVLSAGLLPDSVVVTHEFGLEDYREAIRDGHRPHHLARHQGRVPALGRAPHAQQSLRATMAAMRRRARQPKSPRRGDHRSSGPSAPGTMTLTTGSGTLGQREVHRYHLAETGGPQGVQHEADVVDHVGQRRATGSTRSRPVPPRVLNQPPVGSARSRRRPADRSSRPPWM